MRNGSHRLWLCIAGMRRFMLVAAIAALGAAVLASPAFAFDHHFSVVAKGTIKQVSPNLFRNKERLFDPNNRHDKVGRDHGECRLIPRKDKFNCHLLFHLNGEIGGFGDIRVRGDLDPGPDRLVVLGGSGQFDGVAGKLIGDGAKYHFDLVR